MSMPKPVRARTWRPPFPLPAGVQAPQEQHAGLPGLAAPPSAAGIRPPLRARRGRPPLVRRAHIPDACAAPGPDQEPGRILDSRRRSSRGSRGPEQACLPGGGYAAPAACPASATSWRYGPRRTCHLVPGRSHRPRSTWPDQDRLPSLAVTHRYKPTNCLWLEQFQIADYFHGGLLADSGTQARRLSVICAKTRADANGPAPRSGGSGAPASRHCNRAA